MRDTLSPIFVTKPLPSEKEFSIVSLVATQERYDRLLRSLSAKGFNNENSEFLAIDNRNGNSFDGYSALRGVLPGLSGRYVLLTHDDIELISDGIDELRRLLAKLEALDPKWMLAGNAGGVFIGSGDTHFLHLDDPHGSFRLPTSDPVRVWGLDENFLVMPRHRMPLPSLDFSGFHLFATDMCLQARAAGGTSYVIPFLLRHHGKGLVDGTYPRAQERLERKYSQLSIKGRIQTPAAALAFGWRAKLNAFLSRQGQRLYRIKAKFGRLFARLSRHSRRS